VSGGLACKDQQHRSKWQVLDRQCNHSAFNGYHYTPSNYSSVICTEPGCGKVWRTRSNYVHTLQDYKEETEQP